MSILRFEKMRILSANFGKESSLPPIITKLNLSDIKNEFHLSEDDGLFINYGIEESVYPYKYQDMYDRALELKEIDTAVLENEYLKATFLPGYGGKLWSLIDKRKNEELLFRNDVIRPCNLGVRNAWLSGGVEWNGGIKGHGPFTCSYVHTARTSLADGTPVLRFYYFERIRCAVVQMDVFLPKESEFLLVRVRVTNPNEETIPMYWWSNIGVVEKEGDRVIVPASQSYTAPNDYVVKIDIPIHNGIDVTYPAENITSNDYFWCTGKVKKPYICQLDKEGYGLCQVSTSRLKGRKLFVWGNSQGGYKWRNFLTADDKSGSYDEIQCGLADTQYESLPMAPHTTWEWLEVYGSLSGDKKKIHGTWASARAEVEGILEDKFPGDFLEDILNKTKKMATSKAEEVIFFADGWGALECYRKDKIKSIRMLAHLDFGQVQEEQNDWLNLLELGTIGVHNPTEVPNSYMRQKYWIDLLKKAIEDKDKNNWYAYYLLATAMIAEQQYDVAEGYIKKSLNLVDSVWANFAYAILFRKINRRNLEVEYMLKAYSLCSTDISLAKETLRCLFENGKDADVISIYETANKEIIENKRCTLYYAYALARNNRVDEAEQILCGRGYLVVPDIRECELTETELWFLIRKLKIQDGEEIGEPPRDLDFRMFTKREGWF